MYGRVTLAIALLYAPLCLAQIRVLDHEPPPGGLRAGEKVLVNDGTCPAGQVKQVTGGSDRSMHNGQSAPGSPRTVSCVPRP